MWLPWLFRLLTLLAFNACLYYLRQIFKIAVSALGGARGLYLAKHSTLLLFGSAVVAPDALLTK
jgi:hypothetical protein